MVKLGFLFYDGDILNVLNDLNVGFLKSSLNICLLGDFFNKLTSCNDLVEIIAMIYDCLNTSFTRSRENREGLVLLKDLHGSRLHLQHKLRFEGRNINRVWISKIHDKGIINPLEVYAKMVNLLLPEKRVLSVSNSVVHIGAVKILLKSQFQAGINSPIKMALIDNRITDRQDCILGAAKGNLAYQKFMFSVYPKYEHSKLYEHSKICFSSELFSVGSDLMSPGDKPFTITYLIGYALTNSHHSIDYKKDEYIELDDVFSEIGHIHTPKLKVYFNLLAFLKMNNEIFNNTEENNSEEKQILTYVEDEDGFHANLLIKQDLLSRVKKIDLKIKKENIFKNVPSKLSILNPLKRKNEIFYFVSTKEMSVDIKDTIGAVFLPLLTKEQIHNNLKSIPVEIRSKIRMVHIGAVKILLKSQFQAGINSPIKMALIDNRITDRQDCILGAAKGNLAYQKFMFSVYPKFALDLKSANIDKTLSFIHHFERSDLMSPGDKPFTITYLIGYALTNSHHSIDYKKDEYIELDDVFSEIGHVKDKQFCDINPQENSWVLNIARNKKALGETLRPRISMDSLHIGESSERKDNNLIRNMSLKIDSKTVKIKTLDDNTEKKEYVFSTSGKAGVQTIVNHCNNLNQIIARCLLKTSKISHYLGISKDISTDISKNKIPFNQFKNDLAFMVKNNLDKKDFEKFFEVIEKQNKLTIKLTQSIDKHSILLESSLKNNQFVEEVAKKANIEGTLKETNIKITNIHDQLKQLIG
uniref:Uncharacterized protein n=9 Tax=Lactuca sativa TaxID=4236 RepID=A0A9R1W408_LACSA|nr:hypothetical protein LSAT_V11C300116220 [Lactuca sativa]